MHQPLIVQRNQPVQSGCSFATQNADRCEGHAAACLRYSTLPRHDAGTGKRLQLQKDFADTTVIDQLPRDFMRGDRVVRWESST